MLLETAVGVTTLLLRRRRDMKELRRLERQHLDMIKFHAYQADLTREPENPHAVALCVQYARLRRVRDEQTMLKTGKDYWQIADIDKTAIRMRDLERRRSPDILIEWEAIPRSAIPALHQRIVEMGRHEQWARVESGFRILAALRPEPFWSTYPARILAMRV